MDLSHAMHDAARVATAPRPPMAPGPVLQRIRRRRAARYAVQGTVAVAAAGAAALGGAHLAGRPLPGPASTPTPTPTADQYPWPAGIGCGTVLADVRDLQPTDDTTNLMLEARLTDDAFEQGAPVTGDLTVWFRADAARDGNLGEQTMLIAVRDGVVVGLAEPAVNGEPPNSFGTPGTNPRGDASTVLQLNKRFLACEAGGTAITPLEAGSYELYAVVLGVEKADGSWNPVPFLGGPWTLDVVPAGEPTTEPAIAQLPECGESTASLTASDGQLTGSVTVKVGLLTDVMTGAFLHKGYGDALWIDTAVLNKGPDLYQSWGFVTEVVVAEDGRVVMTWGDEGGDPPPADWPAGTTRLGLAGPVQTAHCTAGTPGILGPGEYTLWVMTFIQAATEPGGEAQHWRPLASVTFRIYGVEDPDNQGPVTWTSAGPTT